MAGLLPQVISNMQGIQGLKSNQLQLDAAQQKQADLRDASAALQDYYKTGNQQSLINATLKSPQLAGQMLSSLGLDDERKQKQAATDVAELWQLRSNPEAFKQKGLQRIDAIMQRGGNPTDTINLLMAYDKDPKQAEMMLQSVGAGLEASGFKTGIFGSGEQMTAYQKESTDLRRQEIEAQRAQKASELKLKTLEAELKREDNDLRRQELLLKIDETKADVEKKRQELDAAKQTKDSGKVIVADAYNEVKSLLESPNLDQAIGTFETELPTVLGSTQDVVNKAKRLQSLLTVDNLKLMSGVLTDKDISFLTNVASGINVTDGGIKGSKEGVRERLSQIMKRLESAAKQKGVELSAPQSQQPEPQDANVIDWGSLN